MKEIDQGYKILATIRARNYASEAKSKILRVLKTELSRNQLNKKINIFEKFYIKVPNSTR